MAEPGVTVIVADRIGRITLNNPPANVLTRSILDQLDRLLGELEADTRLAALVLTGEGRFFCAGADIKELAQVNSTHTGSDLAGRGQALLNRIERFDKPIIAAINGPCLGGGLELAMACHMRIAAAGVTLGLPEITLGLIPGFGGTQRLPRIVGPSRAAEMILTGETITAEQALDLGLVNRVVPATEIVKEATAVAAKVASKGRHAVQAALRAIRTGLDSPMAEGLAREAELFGALCETADKKEGVQAFLEKRPPKFGDE